MPNIFTPQTINYIENQMCINSEEYTQKMKVYSKDIQKVFTALGIYLLTTNVNNDYDLNNDPFCVNAYSLLEEYDLFMGEAFDTADIIIKAFTRYKKNGLLDLYRLAESDRWDPLPSITTSLYSLMSNSNQKIFNNLDDIVTIYRGTSLMEYDGKLYSQSWTLNKEKASYFAFELGEDKYLGTDRVIIEAKIAKKDIFAYIGREEECIINSNKIINASAKIAEKKVFTSLK